VAKREDARRKQVKTPAKVYTNEDLRGRDMGSAAPAPAPANQPAPNAAPRQRQVQATNPRMPKSQRPTTPKKPKRTGRIVL
jgi:hypothetical protein